MVGLHGTFAQCKFAKTHGSGGGEAADDSSIKCGSKTRTNVHAGNCRNSSGIEQIFNSDRNSMKGAAVFPSRNFPITFLGSG